MSTPRKRRLRLLVVMAVLSAAGGSSFALRSAAEEVQPALVSPAPFLRPARPYWAELTPVQRQTLAPLTDDWERLDFQTKQKWLEISKRYPHMSSEDQTRTRDRMREWAGLTPEQRRVARDSFARIQAMPPAQRAEMLRKYQELPLEQRQALASEGRVAKPLIVPKPMVIPTPRRIQIREGAKVRNPALAAEKSDSPVAAIAHRRPAPAPAAPATAPAPASAPATTGAGPQTVDGPGTYARRAGSGRSADRSGHDRRHVGRRGACRRGWSREHGRVRCASFAGAGRVRGDGCTDGLRDGRDAGRQAVSGVRTDQDPSDAGRFIARSAPR